MQLKPGSTLYTAMQWLIFPVSVIGLPLLVHWLIESGLHFSIATYGAVVLFGFVYLALEHLMPFRDQWNKQDGELGTDIISGTVAYIILPKFLVPLYWAVLAGATAGLAAWFGAGVWPTHWPLWLQVVLLLLVGDAGRYWGHRLAHTVPVLWRFHAVHHSAKRLWFWNATRQHPVDKAWFTASEMIFPILLGVNGEVLSLYLAVTVVCGFTQHCNIDVKLGPLYYIFNVADLHRWHHSKDRRESDNNYGNNLIVYDLLFGTRYYPEQQGDDRQVGNIGLLNPNYPSNYIGQFLAPFRRGKLDKADPVVVEAAAGSD